MRLRDRESERQKDGEQEPDKQTEHKTAPEREHNQRKRIKTEQETAQENQGAVVHEWHPGTEQAKDP